MTTALQGIRILDFSRVLAGPFCTMLLADFGADVIKVERPGVGDDTREWGPPYAGDHHMSAYFISVNRNKRSLTLNLKTSEGQQIARQLALQSDVLIENFKVGQMRAYGLDYDSLRAEHPGLIYCSITGYGQDGPYTQRPGYDYVIQGQSGLMSITGPEDGMPYKVGVATADVLAGMYASNAIQAALRYRDSSGEGQYIDVALLEANCGTGKCGQQFSDFARETKSLWQRAPEYRALSGVSGSGRVFHSKRGQRFAVSLILRGYWPGKSGG
jgi:formyl-CoA transferase